MNANGEIEVSNKENVLYVPIEAITTINEKSFIYIQSAAGTDTKSGNTGFKPSGTRTRTGQAPSQSTGQVAGQASGQAGDMGGQTGKLSASASKKLSYYEGSVRTEVQVGLNNDTSIEITTGLKEGDIVVLPETQTASTKGASSSSGMGGGRPGGGF